MANQEDDLSKKTKDLKIKDDSIINILLLGETGVGKSTFINSIANYFSYKNFSKAEKESIVTLIPSKCEINDKYGKRHIIKIGSENDKNECLETGMSATQDVKSYVFPIWDGKIKVRLIDTPGIGDCRGVDQDNINCDNILTFIGQLHELHAICFLFKPTNPRITVFFEYCMTQILSRLDKSASKNIIFIFTNTRGTDYGPGDTYPSLQKVIKGIKDRQPQVDIPLKKNVFCFDNESFRYLAAIKQNIEFDDSVKKRNSESWKKSVEQCYNLIKYIVGDSNNPPLNPHHIKSTSAINEARRLITQLSQPLAEISQLINDNMYVLQRHKDNLDLDSNSIDQLKQKLYMPVIDLEVTKLAQPVTVCAAKKCAEVYKVEGINKWHYKQRCHEPCYLSNVPKEIVGSPELINCAAMNSSTKSCNQCGCDFSTHMHVYYLTKTSEKKIVDDNIKKNIDNKEKLVENVKRLITGISKRKEELEKEHQIIVRTCAKFAHFLQNNAITPFSDSYKEYIDYLINREKSLGVLTKMSVIHHLQNLLREYEAAKESFNAALSIQKKIGENDLITPQKIQESIQELYQLKHNGRKIKELYECQKKSRSKEHKYSEYIHEVVESKPTNQKNVNKTPYKNTYQQKTPQRGTTRRGNQRTNNDRERNRSQSRSSARDPSPPPAYQDVHPERGFQGPRHPPPHAHDYFRNYPGPGHRDPYYRPPPDDYSHPGGSRGYRNPYYDPGRYTAPSGGPLGRPDYRPYDYYDAGYDRGGPEIHKGNSSNNDSYEFKVTLNTRPPHEHPPHGPPRNIPPQPPGPPFHHFPYPPPLMYPPVDPYRDNRQPNTDGFSQYNSQEINNRRNRGEFDRRTQGPDARGRRPQNDPNERSGNPQYNYRGRGGARGRGGQKTSTTSTSKFKNVSNKKKTTNKMGSSDSDSD